MSEFCYYLLASVLHIGFYVFFFRQKTAYEMRISDRSSDVCSSDLIEPRPQIRELTEMQRAFVDAKLNGAGIREAAEIAGYATPERTGYLVLRQASVQRAIEAATRSKLRHDMGPRALETLDSDRKSTRLNSSH